MFRSIGTRPTRPTLLCLAPSSCSTRVGSGMSWGRARSTTFRARRSMKPGRSPTKERFCSSPLMVRGTSTGSRARPKLKSDQLLARAFGGVDALDVLARLKDRDVSLHMIDLGGDVTGNGISKLVFTILSAVAEAERDRTRERITEVKRDQKGRGRYLGGSVPFGFEIGAGGALAAVPEQQAALGLMRRLRGEGMSLRPIAERVTAAG